MVAPDTAVAVVQGGLLSEAVGLADGRVEVDGQRLGARTRTRCPSSAEQLPTHPVELVHVAPAEDAQERAQRGGRLDPEAEHESGATRAQRIGVVDVVATRERRHDQRQDLVVDVGAAGLRPQVDVLVDQLLQAQVMGERRRQDQARIRHQPVVIEGRVDPVEGVG